MPTPGTIVPIGGDLQQAVLNAQNALASARSSGLLEGSLTIRKLAQALRVAHGNLQAATGSQQGMGVGVGGFGTLTGIMPNISREQGLSLVTKPQEGPQTLGNQGPLGRIFAQLLPSVFGNTPSATSGNMMIPRRRGYRPIGRY